MKLTLTIKEIGEKLATLEDGSGEDIIFPLSKLPREIKRGDILTVLITKGENSDKKLAKNILNEILDI